MKHKINENGSNKNNQSDTLNSSSYINQVIKREKGILIHWMTQQKDISKT